MESAINNRLEGKVREERRAASTAGVVFKKLILHRMAMEE